MRNWTIGLLIGVLALVSVGLVLSIAYPFTTTEPHGANPSDERFTVGEADAFSATGRIVSGGETRLALDGAVTADGAWYQRVVSAGVVSEQYRTSNGSMYQRLTVDGADAAEQRRAQLTQNEEQTILRESRAGNCVTFVTKSETPPRLGAGVGNGIGLRQQPLGCRVRGHGDGRGGRDDV